jgi:hypothetical protein
MFFKIQMLSCPGMPFLSSLGRRLVMGFLAAVLGAPVVWSQTSGELAVPDIFGTSANRPREQLERTPSFESVPEGLRGTRGMPYVPPDRVARPNYNIRIGSAAVTFFSSVDVTYSSNALFTADGSSEDILITPSIGASLNWPIRSNQSLRLDVGVGYRKSINFPEFDTLTVMPSSMIDYRFVIGDVLFTLFNLTSTPAGPRPELVGQGENPASIAFNQISNSTGISAGWAPWDGLGVSSSYNYMISRSLGDSFALLDMDQQMVSASAMQRLGPYWGAGLGANYSRSVFRQEFQNDSQQYGAGPMISFTPTPNLTLSASVQYTISTFSTGGAVVDTSEFSGLTYNGSISHRLTKTITHAVSGGRMIQGGIGSNFTDSYNVNYSLGWQFSRSMGLNLGFGWNRFEQSGTAGTLVPVLINGQPFVIPASFETHDEGDVISINAGTGYQITSKLNCALSYGYFNRSSSAFAGRSFSGHTVTLSLGYRF